MRPLGLGPFETLCKERFLLAQLLARDIRARTRGTLLGGFWLLLQPALQILAFWFLLDLVLKARSPGSIRYLDYFLAGMLPWLFFSESLVRSLNVLIEFSPLYQKSRFPVQVLPLIPPTLNLGIYAPIYGVTLALLEGPLAGVKAIGVIFCLYLWTLPLSYLVALGGLFIRELRQIFPFLMSLLLYMTPVLYAPDLLPAAFRWLLRLNPLADVMALIQGILHGLPIEPGQWLRPLGLWLLLLVPSWRLFRGSEPHFRELL